MATPRKSSCSLFFVTLLLTSISSEANDFLVGGSSSAWSVPSSAAGSLNQWAEGNRFQVGDSLVWKYDAEKDSVLRVTREGYLSCNTSSPIAEHKDGATAVRLRRPGPYYFISGAEGACEKGEKLIVLVMSERHALRGLAPAPAPAEHEGPAAPPTSAASQMMVLDGGILAALFILGMLL